MFGLGFGELLVVMIVAVVVLGPKDLPRYMRKAGEMAGRLRQLAFDMREKSGIDEVLRAEGLDRDIAELRRLARGEINGVVSAVRSTADAIRPELRPGAAQPGATGAAAAPAALPVDASPESPAPPLAPAAALPAAPQGPLLFATDREYPPDGPDAYGALPATSSVYDGALPQSDLAGDPLYARGEDPGPARATAGAAG